MKKMLSSHIKNATTRHTVDKVIIIITIFLMAYLGMWTKIINAARYNLSNLLLNRSLYDQTLLQDQRERMLRQAVWLLPKDSVDDSPNLGATQEEAILFADFARKKRVWSHSLWENALNQPSSSDNWPSFEMPPNLNMQSGTLYIPFDNRWKIRETFRWENQSWQHSQTVEPKMSGSDELKVIAKNTKDEYELFIISWYGPIGSGPYHILDFEVQPLPDTSFSVVVHQQDGETFEVPVEIAPNNKKAWIDVRIPLSVEKIAYIDFYVSDKNLEKESLFGITIRKGSFSF